MGLLDDTLNCAKEQFGFPGELGVGMLAANGPYPKAMFGVPRGLADASELTTALSVLAQKYPELDMRINALRPLFKTPSLLRSAGRTIPMVGAGLLGYDVGSIANCVMDKTP